MLSGKAGRKRGKECKKKTVVTLGEALR